MKKLEETPSVWLLFLIVLFACLVTSPCLLWGLRFGHDHNLHITYLHFFETQLRAGEPYPRWISELNFGAGSPIFFIQYPLPYYAAAGLQWLFHISPTASGSARALGLFVVLTGILSGVFTWLWCRSLSNPFAALLASAVCLTMPYLVGCDVYYRGAIGEYSALAWVPLALFFAHRLSTDPLRAVAGIAVAFAMIGLSHPFTAVLFAPFLILYAVTFGNRVKMPVLALLASCGLLLGSGISAVYFLPMNVHRHFFSMANLIRLGSNNFSYRTHLFPFGTSLFPNSSLRVRLVGLITRGVGYALAGLLIVRWRRTAWSLTAKITVALAIVCILLTCVAPLMHVMGFSPHAELAIPRVSDVRGRIFLVTFLTLEVAVFAFSCLPSYASRVPQFFLAASLACYFLSTRWSEGIWQHASFLWNMQFPWRFSGLMSIFAVGLVAFSLFDTWESPNRQRALLAGIALCVTLGLFSVVSFDIDRTLSHPFFTDFKSGTETPYLAYANIASVPAPNELGLNDGFVNGVLLAPGDGTARLDTITPRHLRLAAGCLQPCTILLKLVYYPFWLAHENSLQPIPLHASSRAGLTELSLNAGNHDVNLELPVGRSEIWGTRLSFLSICIVMFLFFLGRSGNRAIVML